MPYTYILKCADGSLYTGWSVSLDKRILAHNQGKASKYTRPRRPVVCVYFETFSNRSEAMRREVKIKQMTRAQKLKLINKTPCIKES